MIHKKVDPNAPKSRTLKVEMKPGESHDHLMARVAASPHLGAAGTIMRYGKVDVGEVSITELVGVLTEQADTIKNGDVSNIEAMLGSQATALNVIFTELARRAAFNMGEYLDTAETYLKLALRAQSQCRATLETLATIKSPPVVIAKQANIAHGPQQVNNGDVVPVARAKQIEKLPNELLERDHGGLLDTRAKAQTSGGDQKMAAMEVIHGTAHGTRQSKREP